MITYALNVSRSQFAGWVLLLAGLLLMSMTTLGAEAEGPNGAYGEGADLGPPEKLKHPHVVPVFDVGHQDGVWYYAMQFIPGQGLDDVLLEVNGRAVRDPWSLHQAIAEQDPGDQVPAKYLRGEEQRDVQLRLGFR